MPTLAYTDAFIADPLGLDYPDEPTGRLVDLSTLEQNRSAVGFGLVDGGSSADFDTDTFEDTELAAANVDGGRQVAFRRRSRLITIPLIYRGNRGQALTDLRALATAVAEGGVFVWQVEGQDEPEYWDFVASPFAEALTGRPRDLYRMAKLLFSDTGWPLRMKCYPWPRTAPVILGPFTVSNALLAGHARFTQPGNRPSEARIEAVTDAGSVGEARYGIRSGGDLDEYVTAYERALADESLKVDTSAVAVADSSGTGGTAADCDFTEDTLQRRVRCVIDLTNPSALERTHKAYLRMRARAGTDGSSRFRVQLRYGFTTADLVMQTREKVPFDWRDVDTPNYIDVPLGGVKVPMGTKTVVLEVWAARLEGDQHLAFDKIRLEPTTYQHTTLAVPGQRMGEWGHQRFDSDEFDGDGVLRRGTYRLNNNGEVGYALPANGIRLPAGVHVFGLDAWLREYEDNSISSGPNPPSIKMGELQVIEEWTTNVRKRVALRTFDDELWSHVYPEVAFNVTAGEEAANRRFILNVEFTAADQAGRAIRIEGATHRFLEGISNDKTLVIDAKVRRSFVLDTASDGTLFSVLHENALPLLPPGDQAHVWALGDLATDPGYQDLDRRQPSARSVRDRSAQILYKIWPRWSH